MENGHFESAALIHHLDKTPSPSRLLYIDMAPSAVDVAVPVADLVHKKLALNGTAEEPATQVVESNGNKDELQSAHSKASLKLSGILDQFKSFDVTPVIGKEFPTADLAEWLRAPNSDELLRDLAITGSSCLTL